MCGRYSFAIEDELIKERFGVSVRSAIYKARYNCAPSQELAIISNQDPEELQFFRWGLVPFWARDPSIGNKLINAKVETIAEKPSFKNAFRKRRCLVPADGFYEWKKNSAKIPFRIIMNDGSLFAMAGIWEKWVSGEGGVIHSFSIITTEPNELMAPIHNRMPVILLPENEKLWLDDSNEAVLRELLKPYPADRMTAYPVSKLVNSPKNDVPEVTLPISD
ncbi:MAG: SOS response-associated peptidase [Bacteroidetes bacterium]|nr:MAG: SOS response-associated peptidase [Bacteroidota bacterium]